MNRSALVAAAVLAASSGVHAQMKPEDQVKQRRAGMAIIGYNFGSLAAMAQEKKPYNREEAGRNADLVAALAEYPHGFFVPGTEKVGDTKAKPEVWTRKADFDDKMKKMITEAKQLPQAARSDLATLKKQFGETGKACKACHDEYRAKST